jgi:hypothetical protein
MRKAGRSDAPTPNEKGNAPMIDYRVETTDDSHTGTTEAAAGAWGAAYEHAERLLYAGYRDLITLHVGEEVAFVHFGATGSSSAEVAEAAGIVRAAAARALASAGTLP